MAFVLRIIVNDTDPLDGVSGFPPDAEDRLVYDSETGVYTIELQAGEPFGSIGAGGPLGEFGSYVVKDLAVVSAGGPHADGSFVALRGPENPNAPGSVDRVVLPLGPTDNPLAAGTGLWPEGLNEQLAVGHELVFDTAADGPAPGPHLIQLGLDPAVSAPFMPPISPFGDGGPQTDCPCLTYADGIASQAGDTALQVGRIQLYDATGLADNALRLVFPAMADDNEQVAIKEVGNSPVPVECDGNGPPIELPTSPPVFPGGSVATPRGFWLWQYDRANDVWRLR